MLAFTIHPWETVTQAMLRYAAEYGLTWEVLSFYRTFRRAGHLPQHAAFYALSEWDLLDYTP